VRRGRPRVPHFLAGVVTIVAVVGGAWMAFAGVPFQGGHELRAVFASAPEIGTRSPVRIAGVEVGKVTRVERGEGATAVVTMELDDAALPVHADATVRVRPRIFLEGNFFLDLRPGTPGGRELGEGDAIPVAQTSAAVQLDEVLSALGAANGVLDQAEALLAPGELPRARRALAPAVVSLARLRPRLVTVFDLLRPVSECLRKNALPALQSSVEDPPHTTGLPVYQEFLHAITGLASASQDFDANGAAVRYHANFGHQTLTTGRLPATNEVIYGIADQPLLGSRPRSVPLPPFRPDVPCETQDPPDLRAATAPPPPQRELTEAERARLRRGGDDG
jgi:hypothetical protein